MRITTRNTGLQTRAAFNDAVDEIAEITVEIRGMEADRDKAIQLVRDRYDPEIEGARDRMSHLMALAEAYAFDHRDAVFPRGKSGATSLAQYGLRVGQPTLKTQKRWTWKKVLEVAKELAPWAVKVKETLDKEAIRSQLGHDPVELAKLGCTIEQTEAFWVEAKDKEGGAE